MMGKGPVICSIISKNRLAYARTLTESFLSEHPDGKCYMLLIDKHEGFIDPAREKFEILKVEELGISNLSELRFKYTPFELCCALKPVLMKHLLQYEKIKKIFYLDTDIMVFGSFDGLSSLLNDYEVILTPHLDKDFPQDGKRPDKALIMLSGVYNAGFIGVRDTEEGARFLDWWAGMLEDHCIEDHERGYFVDQKFLDLAPAAFGGVGFVSEPGCNVAYWNLHTRKVSRNGPVWRVNDEPLVFYHFSGYDPYQPGEMARHQNRYELADMPDLQALFGLYRTRIQANGDSTCREWAYEYGFYLNGRKIRRSTRRAYLFNSRFRDLENPFDSSTHPMALKLMSFRESGLSWLKYFVTQALPD